MLFDLKQFDPRTLLNAATVALFVFVVIGFGGAVWQSSNTPHAPINQNASAQHKEERASERPKESAEEAIARYNYWLTIFTAVLATATVILGLATIGLYFAGERQLRHVKEEAQGARRRRWEDRLTISEQIAIAKDNTDAAKKSADAAIATERARFYPVIDHNFLDCINAVNAWDGEIPDSQQLAASNWPMARINFKNYGKTPGIISEVSTGIVYSESPPDPVYDEKVVDVNANIVAAGEISENFSAVQAITLGNAKKAKRGEGHIWIYGKAIYDDVFGETHTHRFLQRLVPVNGGFRYVLQSYDYKHYNRST